MQKCGLAERNCAGRGVSIGEIAAPAARNADFLARAFGVIDDQNAIVRACRPRLRTSCRPRRPRLRQRRVCPLSHTQNVGSSVRHEHVVVAYGPAVIAKADQASGEKSPAAARSSRAGCPYRKIGGAGGIRTLDRALQPYNGLANRRLQPLGHSSNPNFSRSQAEGFPCFARLRGRGSLSATAPSPTILARKADLLHQIGGWLKAVKSGKSAEKAP